MRHVRGQVTAFFVSRRDMPPCEEPDVVARGLLGGSAYRRDAHPGYVRLTSDARDVIVVRGAAVVAVGIDKPSMKTAMFRGAAIDEVAARAG